MKIRTSFVSNSSSSSFILDIRKPGVKELLKEVNKDIIGLVGTVKDTDWDGNECEWNTMGYARHTCCEAGKSLKGTVTELTNDYEWPHGDWILGWIDKLGVENVVYLRESDEDMGGNLFTEGDPYDSPNDNTPYGRLRKLAEEEMEYH